jgi:hypothetical protein
MYSNYRKWVHTWLASIMNNKPRQVVDVTSSEISMPEPVQYTVRMLDELGFQQFAITETHLPTLDTVGITWLLINAEKDVSAEVVEYKDRAAVQFTTWYNDDSLVETSYPIGENINTKTFRSHFTREGIAEAYLLHKDQMQQFTAQTFRVPAATRSFGVFAERERIYQLKYKPIKFRAPLLRGIGITVSMALVWGLGLVAVGVYAVPELHVANPRLVHQIAIAIIGLSGSAYLYFIRKAQHHADE